MKFENGKVYEIEGSVINQANAEFLKVEKYRNRKNEYKKGFLQSESELAEARSELNDLKLYVSVLEEDVEGLVDEGKEWEGLNDSLKADLVSYDELVDQQRKVINDLTEMCQIYSKYVNELEDNLEEVNQELLESKNTIIELYEEIDGQDAYIVELEDTVSEDFTLEEAVTKLREELGKDRTNNSLYYTYQANIAMSFSDQLTWWGYKIPNQGLICNEAAKQFLELFIGIPTKES